MTALYYIQAGVRRAVAAQEAGWTDLPAIIYDSGQAPVFTRVRVDARYSPKSVIPRDPRYIVNTEYTTAVLKTQPPPIEVQPLGQPGQTASIPLAQVRLV
jgi:hypothetical protein